MIARHLAFLAFYIGVCLSAQAEPWRASRALNFPPELKFWGETRTRYQSFDNQFRPGLQDFDRIILQRTIIGAEYRFNDTVRVGAELLDARGFLDDESTRVFTGIINPLDLLQAYIAFDFKDTFGDGNRATLTLGRITIDQGRRRFIARQRFRNTVNAYTGARFQWQSASKKHDFDAFWVLPVRRLPVDRLALLDDEPEADEESLGQNFWGLFYKRSKLPYDLTASAFIYGLHERDTADINTRNRQLFTPGFGLWHISKPGQYHLDLQGAVNIGQSRLSSSPADTDDLDHFAYFFHAEAGYRFDAPLSPRLLLQYDIASGDADPTDGRNGRFDNLFGQRRADFGHTDIYGPFGPFNIEAFAAATHLFPHKNIQARVRYQAAFLEEPTDAWVPIGLRDITGQSGTFIGHQIETRFQWKIIPGNVIFEAGSGYLINGEFAENAPNANGFGDAFFFYTDLTLRF